MLPRSSSDPFMYQYMFHMRIHLLFGVQDHFCSLFKVGLLSFSFRPSRADLQLNNG